MPSRGRRIPKMDRSSKSDIAGGPVHARGSKRQRGGLPATRRDGRRLADVEPPLWFWQGRAFGISRMELSTAGGQVVSRNELIASDGGNQSAQPSPDGRQIVFQSGRTGRPEIWRSEADGSGL